VLAQHDVAAARDGDCENRQRDRAKRRDPALRAMSLIATLA
jgi:hypothetical protein